jgi:hypothetical protein
VLNAKKFVWSEGVVNQRQYLLVCAYIYIYIYIYIIYIYILYRGAEIYIVRVYIYIYIYIYIYRMVRVWTSNHARVGVLGCWMCGGNVTMSICIYIYIGCAVEM